MLVKFQQSLQRVHRVWRARHLINMMTPEQQAMLRLKILGYVLLGSRTKNWGMNLRWQGDYLAMPLENNDNEAYSSGILQMQSSGLFRRVVFSTMVYKLSHRVRRAGGRILRLVLR